VTLRGFSNRDVFLLLFLSVLLLLLGKWPGTRAQDPCPLRIYGSNAPWAPGSTVNYSFDATGALGAATNPPPAFTLDAIMQAAYANGMTAWNAHASQNGTQVTYTGTTSGGTDSHTVTVAWPSATLTWTDSAGHTHTQQFIVGEDSSNATAATFYVPDHNSSNQVMPTAAAAITLINTNGTYPVDNSTYPMWDPAGANFLNALTQNGTHETGHGMGLGERPPGECGNVMSGPSASSQNPTGATNNNGGCASSTITPCDDEAIFSNPDYPSLCRTNADCPMGFICNEWGGCEESLNSCQLDSDCPWGYTCNTTTGECQEPTSDCQSDEDCTCGGACNWLTGNCTYTYECSPIIIPVGQSAQIRLTSPQAGVWFDMDADGRPDRVAWTTFGDPTAFLVRDVNGNGRIDNGAELFGNHTVLPGRGIALNGFDALAYYERVEAGGNADGVIDSSDGIWSDLRLWVDSNHNGISEAEELYDLGEFQLTAISVVPRVINRADAYGNVLRLQASCQVRGTIRFGYDVYFSARPPRRPD